MPKHQEYSQIVKSIRNKFRGKNLISVVNAARKIMFSEDKIQYCPPAYVLLMLKIVIEDQSISMVTGEECDEHFFLLRSRELFSEGTGIFTRLLEDPTEHNVNKWMRTYLQNQTIVNAEFGRGLFRISTLILKYDGDGKCTSVFEQSLGLSPENFITAALLVYAPIQKHGRGTHLDTVYYNQLNEEAKRVVSVFLSLFSRTIDELRSILQGELQERIKKWRMARSYLEIVEMPWLSRYPLLKKSDREYLTWQPQLLALSLENAAHMMLSEAGHEDYTKTFSPIFESYVVDLIQWSGLTFMTEEEYAKHPGNRDRAKVDSIINIDKKINVYVEVKMSLFKDDLVINDSSDVIFNKLERIREAMGQGWTVSEYFHDDLVSIEPYSQAQQHYMFIVTSKEIYCPSGCHVKDLVGDDNFKILVNEKPERNHNEKRLQIIPLENIFIFSIEDFEYLIHGVHAGDINLEEFLESVRQINLTIKGAVSQIPEYIKSKTELKYPPLLEEEFNRVQKNAHDLLLGDTDSSASPE